MVRKVSSRGEERVKGEKEEEEEEEGVVRGSRKRA